MAVGQGIQLAAHLSWQPIPSDCTLSSSVCWAAVCRHRNQSHVVVPACSFDFAVMRPLSLKPRPCFWGMCRGSPHRHHHLDQFSNNPFQNLSIACVQMLFQAWETHSRKGLTWSGVETANICHVGGHLPYSSSRSVVSAASATGTSIPCGTHPLQPISRHCGTEKYSCQW